MESDDVDWEKLEQGVFGKASRPKPFTVKEHQQKALDKVHEYFKTHDRGKLIMACGTGKTFTALKIAEQETDNKGLVLFLVPSIALLGQTLRSWSQQASVPIHAICICSDGQVSRQEVKNDESGVSVLDLALPASTDITYIVHQLDEARRQFTEGMTVVFSTYQSIEVISKAQAQLLAHTDGEYGVFDLIICDEAHRTTGVSLKGADESAFVKVHNNDFIKTRHRIYMTATPRLYTDAARKKAEENNAVLCSMDDVSLYGDEIYHIGFGEAVKKQLLTDYKVFILAVGDKDITPALRDMITNEDGTITTNDASKFIGCINALSKRVLGDEGLIKATYPLPMHRAVVFVSPKNSQVDVVQAVGRVMRRSEGKKYGYIIIPVVIPETVEGEEVLSKHPNFKVVWTVLNGLRAHDDRFEAEVSKIELSKSRPKHILFGGVPNDDDSTDSSLAESKEHRRESAAQKMACQLSMQFEDLQNVFYAKMVTKVGSKRYWELWAKDIAQITEGHIERIKKLIVDDGRHKRAFDQLMKGLRRNINPNLTEEEAIEMLSQHLISLPVFEALFGNYEFAASNPVSKSMQKMLALLDDETKTEEEHERLQQFYDYVRRTVGRIKEAEGRQRLIVELYDKFFKVASPLTVEVVDYIIRSVAYIIQKEFGHTLSDENVHILDPFTGTGTFITRLLQNGVIDREALARKYRKEIHANEIVLMTYYIASINIESVYHSLLPEEDYKTFEGICLTDTFQLGENASEEHIFSEQFPTNSKRVMAQKRCPITVIVGNPPYSIGQKSANDNTHSEYYPTLYSRIINTYRAESEIKSATSVKALRDSYIKAFRWASDRLDKQEGGIIGFITNGAYLDGISQDGMRKCLQR